MSIKELPKITYLLFLIIIVAALLFSGCLSDKPNESTESEEFRTSFFVDNNKLRISFSEDTAVEKWIMEEISSGIVYYEDSGTIISETPSNTEGTHVWEFYGEENGAVELDFKLVNLSNNSIKEQFVYAVTVDNRSMKMTSIQQLNTPKNLLEKEIKIDENGTSLRIVFQEYLGENEQWTLNFSEENVVEVIGSYLITQEGNKISRNHQWSFEGNNSGNVQLTYEMETNDGKRKEEITYVFWVNEDKTIDLIDSEYHIFTK
jgi:hypothetical protein